MQADCETLKKFGTIDAYFDIGPSGAHASTHIKSAILALRHGARISLMGGYREGESVPHIHAETSVADLRRGVAIPHVKIMHSNMRLFGKWMYERSDILNLFKLVENGMLRLDETAGIETPAVFSLQEWKEALEQAAEDAGFGQNVVIKP